MSKFMLSMGLVLTSLVGFSGGAQAQLPVPGNPPLLGSAGPQAPWWDATVGNKWTTPQQADQFGRQMYFDGQVSRYEVVQGPDGYYYVRLQYIRS